MRDELLVDETPWTVSDSGWSNTEIFIKYMKEHLIKFIPARDAENPVLIIFMMVMLHMFHYSLLYGLEKIILFFSCFQHIVSSIP
jgi:hypothetical protein